MSRRQLMIAESGILRHCAGHWAGNRRIGSAEDAFASYLAPLTDVASSLFAVTVDVDPLDFRFHYWGDRLKRFTGHDLTGVSLGDPALGRFGRLQKAEYMDAMLEGASITSRGCFFGRDGVSNLEYLRGVFPVYGPEMTCRMIFGAIDFEGENASGRNAKVDFDAVRLHDVAQSEMLELEFL